MAPFSARPGGVVGAMIIACATGLYTLGTGTGETADILAATFGDQYTVRLTCGGGRAFSEYTHGFSRAHAGGKAEESHPGCEASRVTPVRHHYRAGVYSTGTWL